MALTYRGDGAWGSGKGSNLTVTEFDTNTYTFHTRILALETTPPEAVSIDHFVVTGSLFTIVLTDATVHGPFVLPIAQWRFVGEWSSGTTYLIGDILTESGNLYFVRVQHVSDVTFDPDLFTIDGQVYILILPRATHSFGISFYNKDVVGEGDDILFQYVADRDFVVAANFEDSQCYLRVATSTSPITIPIYQNGAVIGSMEFVPGVDNDAAGGQYGVFIPATVDTEMTFTSRDIVAIGQPYNADLAAAGLTVSIKATVPGVA
jgi:hypothetical protein